MSWFRAGPDAGWLSILGEVQAEGGTVRDPLAAVDDAVLAELLRGDPVLEHLGASRTAIGEAIGESYRRVSSPGRTTSLAGLAAAIWVGSAVLLQATINILTNEKQWWALVVVALVAFVGAMAYRLRRFQIRSATWASVARLAQLYVKNALRLTEDLSRAQALLNERQQEARRMARALEHMNASLAFLSQAVAARSGRATAAAWRQALLSALQFFSVLAQKQGCAEPRCGLIVRDPEKPEELIPLLLYKPGEPNYPSKSRFRMKDDFSGKLIRAFEENCDAEDFRDFLYDYISDTDEHIKVEKDPRFRVVERHHRKIRAILGAIVYKKENGNRVCQGALNLDSLEKDGIDFRRFRELSAQQRPMFRVMNTVLTLAMKEQSLFNAIRTPGNHARKGVADAPH